MKPSRSWLKWLEVAAAVVIIGFLAAYLIRNWGRVEAHDWTVDWLLLALSMGLLAMSYSGIVLLWRHLLARLGGTLSVVDAHRIWYLSNFARYVPGKVLQLAGTAYLARSKGVSPSLSIASTVIAQMFALGGGVLVAVLAFPATSESLNPAFRSIAWIAAGLFLIALLTPLFGRLHRIALRILGRHEQAVPIPLRERIFVSLSYVGLWIMIGGAFHLFVRAVADPAPDSFWPIVGSFAAAYLAGYIAVFVPGGLGIREGALAVLLAFYVPPTVAVAVAFLARLWSTAVELLVGGLLLLVYGLADLRSGERPLPRGAHG